MFSVSTHARYALRALQYIASHGNEGSVPLSKIAAEEDISRKYLENIFTLLRKGGIVRSTRGPDGGYALAKKPEEISLWEIVSVADGKVSTAECVDTPEICARYEKCESKDIWDELQRHIETFLKDKTLVTGENDGLHG